MPILYGSGILHNTHNYNHKLNVLHCTIALSAIKITKQGVTFIVHTAYLMV